MATKELPLDVMNAAVSAIGKAFWYKAPLQRLLLRAGVPQSMFDRYSDLPKYSMARQIFGDLEAKGEAGNAIAFSIVEQLCAIRKITDDKVNANIAMAALDELRVISKAALLESATDVLERQRRAKAEETRLATSTMRDQALERCRLRFSDMLKEENSQKRGYDLESLLEELFRLNELEYRSSFRAPAQQIDGAFRFNSFDYLVEVKWIQSEASLEQLNSFKSKVDSKITSTRGLFLSMTGFRDDVVEQFQRGRETNVILMTGEDLVVILEQRIGLTDALELKATKAAHEGKINVRLRDHLVV